MCKAVLGFHTIMGSDQSGRFHGSTKHSCWNDTWDAFIHFWGSHLKEDADFPSLESFIITLYCKNKVLPGVKNLAELRWYLFSKNQSESQKMSLTYAALHEKVLHAHYTALQWKSAHIAAVAWSRRAWLEMKHWNATVRCCHDKIAANTRTVSGCKSGCNTNRCKCLNNGKRKCTETCNCENCKSVEWEDLINFHDHDLEENEENELWLVLL